MLTGEKILGYKLERMLGQGGMGEVYRGVHPALGQEVAVKVLDPVLARDPELRERFIQEARIQIGLRHQGIVQVLTADTEGEHLALVMEYVEGLSLDELIRKRGHLPPAEAASLFGQVLDALSFAHRNGVIHRDIKPSNIMVQADGEAKIMDFGIAKVLGSTKLTQTGTAIGSAHYMSPEQVLGKKDIDHRTDIYSLGVSLYEALVGLPPFAEEGMNTDSDFKIKDAQVRKEPTDPRKLQAEVPSEMAKTVLSAMAKDREERWQSAAEMKEAMVKVKAKASASAAKAKTQIWHGSPVESMEEDAPEAAVGAHVVGPTIMEMPDESSEAGGAADGKARVVAPTTFELSEDPATSKTVMDEEARIVAPTTMEVPPLPAPTTVETPPNNPAPAKSTVVEVKRAELTAAAAPFKAIQPGSQRKKRVLLAITLSIAVAILGFYLIDEVLDLDGLDEATETLSLVTKKEKGSWQPVCRDCDTEQRLARAKELVGQDKADEAFMQVAAAMVEADTKKEWSKFDTAHGDLIKIVEGYIPRKENLEFTLSDWCSKKDGSACYALGELLEHDKRLDVSVYEQSCANKFYQGCATAGWKYYKGNYFEGRMEKVFNCLRSGCDAGHAPTCFRFGAMYIDKKTEYKKAASLLNSSCNANYANACGYLGAMYLKGLGVGIDKDRANELFEKACKGGGKGACKAKDPFVEMNLNEDQLALARELTGTHLCSCHYQDYFSHCTVAVEEGKIRVRSQGNDKFEGWIEVLDERRFRLHGSIALRKLSKKWGDTYPDCGRKGTYLFRRSGARKYWRHVKSCRNQAYYFDIYTKKE